MVRLATEGFFRFCRKCFGIKVERWFHRCTDIKCPLCLSKMRTPFGPFWPFFIGCMVSADYWLADYPEPRRTTQPSTIGGPLGEPGFCIFCSTALLIYPYPMTCWHENICRIKIREWGEFSNCLHFHLSTGDYLHKGPEISFLLAQASY